MKTLASTPLLVAVLFWLFPASGTTLADSPSEATRDQDDRQSHGQESSTNDRHFVNHTGALQTESSNSYTGDWSGSRRWIGPDWWANPMTDWSLRDGAAIAEASANRTLCLLAAELTDQGSGFKMSVRVELVDSDASQGDAKQQVAAGFRIGRRGGIDDYRHALVHATQWIDAVIRKDGAVVVGEAVSDQKLSLAEGPVVLTLEGTRQGDAMQLQLTASRGSRRAFAKQSFDASDLAGGISLLSNGLRKPGGTRAANRFAFRDFELNGDSVRVHSDRSFGPILWTQYTLSNRRLRLQAQLAPLDTSQELEAELWVASSDRPSNWSRLATSPVKRLSRTVTFTEDGWPSSNARDYQVRIKWNGDTHTWQGTVRREPVPDEPLRLGCFSCDNGYLFPIPAMVSQVRRQNPDMMFFAGDQIYEGYGGFGVARNAETELAMLDYLRKYYQFGWTWRQLMRDRPTVILPDDHDVFQGNLWGHGGRQLPESDKPNNWNLGGYLMPGRWVRAVEETQVGHLPDPAVDLQLPIGIEPYFTSMVYGGIGFAILEDRKFKTGPMSIPEDLRDDGEGAELLGTAQEAFLARWASDWSGHRMKCALSQTIFCNAATHSGRELKRAPYFFDSGAWPKAARNRAVRILGDCNALSIHGDQHLGILLRQGVDDFDDANYAFMVPGTANGFPRAWWPGVGNGVPETGQDFTGRFHDDAGHPIHVLAVGNPEPGSNKLPASNDPMTVGYRKGSGYGMVDFNKKAATATISLYRLGDQGEMFEGFPQTIKVGGKP